MCIYLMDSLLENRTLFTELKDIKSLIVEGLKYEVLVENFSSNLTKLEV